MSEIYYIEDDENIAQIVKGFLEEKKYSVTVTIPITVIPVVLFINMAYIDSMVFLHEASFIPILLFILAMIGFVALAYYIGAKKVLGSSLIDSLRDDTTI